ncbi:GNAT family N-acetyltransferase [Nocardia higoensis]|uniref:GNAT family N-acetyltransferase n=1 Tax=Nocardia higoensis TaxID=228599 RepID=UPI0002EC7615|nr:GNAT family N-acetyltransferase [Nocardia higoensis]
MHTDLGELRLGLESADRAGVWAAPVCDLYDETFSVAPFVWPDGESARHKRMLERLALDPTFGIAAAWHPVLGGPDALVGFVYGIGLKPDTDWWSGFVKPVPDEVISECPGRTFAVIDLAVAVPWRRRGVGRRLMDVLLGSRTEERATLAVQPQAQISRDFYAGIGGWQLLGRQLTPGYVSPEFDIYVRDLTATPG